MAPNDKVTNDVDELVQIKPTTKLTGEEIVISGISGIFPNSNDVGEFMNNLYNKIDMITYNNEPWQLNHPEIPKYLGKVLGFNKFDAQFFGVSHGQSESMDCMTKKILENAYGALFDAGVNPRTVSGRKLGVFSGASYFDIMSNYENKIDTYTLTGNSRAMMANRISYWLDVKGPSFTIDSSCASSMAALNHAYAAIKDGLCESAIVTGSNLCAHPKLMMSLRRAGFLCLDGKTKCFDKNADGYARSEAAAVLFLQKARDAKRIYAEIVHVNGEYHTRPDNNFLPLRNSDDLEHFLNEFYSEVNISPKDLEYNEAFGAGLKTADANELEAISRVFAKDGIIKIGCVKSNMGHSDGASDICALTKACLAYHNGELPANLHYNNPQDHIPEIKDGRIQIVTETTPFNRGYIAVNSFSFSGSNYHALLKGHYKRKCLDRYHSSIPRLVLASGRTDESVSKIFDSLKNNSIDAEQIALLQDFFAAGISGHTSRGFVVLDTGYKKETICLSENVNHYPGTKAPVWFLYSGMGSQWPTMGAELMKIPTFAASIERCRKVLETKGIDLIYILTSEKKHLFDNILFSFVGIAAIQIALTDLLKEMSIVPDNIIGHSLGELGCAYADGCFTAEETMLLSYSRGLVSIESKFVDGLMAAVGLGHEQVSLLCPPEIEVACHNSSTSSTISGPADSVREFVKKLTNQGIFVKEIQTASIAYHSRYIAEAGPSFLSGMKEIIKTPKRRSDKWICTSAPPENWDRPETKYASSEYFVNNFLSNVYFEEAARSIPDNATVIEIAPHGLMQAIVVKSHRTCTHIPLTRRGHPASVNFFLEAVGKMFQSGLNPKIDLLYPKIEYPVSTETPPLSPLVGWAHIEDWESVTYIKYGTTRSSTRNFAMSIDDDDWSFLKGHVRNDTIIFPETALLVLVWETLAMYKGLNFKEMSVIFEEVQFEKAVCIGKKEIVRFTIEILTGSCKFEIADAGCIIASGFIKHVKDPYIKNDITEVNYNDYNNVILTTNGIYKLLRFRGFTYTGKFQSILSLNPKSNTAKINWTNEWITFLDSLIQFTTVVRHNDGVSTPKFIRKLTINTGIHSDEIRVTGLNASYDNLLDVTSCGGVQIQNIIFKNNHRKETQFNKHQRDLAAKESKLPQNVSLINNKIGDIGGLTWKENSISPKSLNSVRVSFAGISLYDCQKAVRKTYDDNETFGMDFSGYNTSDIRVMGLVASGGLSAIVDSDPALLWQIPKHWSLQDAATVPLPYAHAYYCLKIRNNLQENDTVLVLGSAGSLGQALITICLEANCTVFVTVSNQKKKLFLLEKFPKLKEENIVCLESQDLLSSVSSHTNQHFCNYVFSSASEDLRELAMKCVGHSGTFLDLSEYDKEENLNWGLWFLTRARNYKSIKFSNIFRPENLKEKQLLHSLLSDGINRGIVTPISSVVYVPNEVSKAFRFVSSRERIGRVLINMEHINNDTTLNKLPNVKNTPFNDKNGQEMEPVNFMDKVSKIIDIPDIKAIDENVTLRSLKVNQVCVDEIRNLLNKTFQVDYSTEELLRFSIASLKKLSSDGKLNAKTIQGLRAFYNYIESDEMFAGEPIVIMPSKIGDCIHKESEELDPKEPHLIMIPGFEGHCRIFSSIGERLKIQAASLQLSPGLDGDTIPQMAKNLLKHIKDTFVFTSKFYILGYSFGVNIALELAALLENEGHVGVVYCLDSSPDAVNLYIEVYLGTLSESDLQNTILTDICNVITENNIDELKEELYKLDDWLHKVEHCLKKLKKAVNYSHEYQKAIMDSLYKRIKLAKAYQPNLKLKSQLVLIKGETHQNVNLANDYNLSKYTTEPVSIFNIESDHLSAPYDCEIPNIVNKKLEAKLLDKYKNQNLCEVFSNAPVRFQGSKLSALRVPYHKGSMAGLQF